MKKLITLALLFSITFSYSQEITTSGKYIDSLGNSSNSLTKAYSKIALSQFINNTDSDTIYHPSYSIVKGWGNIKVIDTIDFYATLSPDYNSKDSIIFFEKKFKLQRVRTFGDFELNSIGIPFTVDRYKTKIYNISGNSFVARAYLSQQCKIKSITLNGVDSPTNTELYATEPISGLFRHNRLISGFIVGRNVVVIDYENDIGNITTIIFYVSYNG